MKYPQVEDTYDTDSAFLETRTGLMFDPQEPVFEIEDIAHGLAMNCRFNGQTRKFISVAEHSLIVSLLMEELNLGDPLEGLLHDASEAYLTDIPAPLKPLLPDWQAWDKRLEKEVREFYELPLEKSNGCQKADWLCLMIEAHFLMPSKGEFYPVPDDIRAESERLIKEGWRPFCLEPGDAANRFLERYRACVRSN